MTEADLADVRGAIFGTRYLAFEAGAPTFSVWLDDYITAKLSVVPLLEAVADPARDDVAAVFERGIHHIPEELAILATPLPHDGAYDSLTFQTGPRTMLYEHRSVFGADYVLKRADLLPLAGFYTAAVDPKRAFRLNLERTTRLSLAEGVFFDESTRSLLEGRPLRLATGTHSFERRPTPEMHAAWQPVFRAAWGPSVGDMEGDVLALWSINRFTGEVLGLIGDGTGGGRQEERIRRQLQEFERVLAVYNLVPLFAGPGIVAGIAAGGVAAYGQFLVRMYGGVSLVIINMDASTLDEFTDRAMLALVCDLGKTVALGLFAGLGNVARSASWTTSGLDSLLSLLAVDNPFACKF